MPAIDEIHSAPVHPPEEELNSYVERRLAVFRRLGDWEGVMRVEDARRRALELLAAAAEGTDDPD